MANFDLTADQWVQIIGPGGTRDQQVQTIFGQVLVNFGVPDVSSSPIVSSSVDNKFIIVPAGISAYARPTTPRALISATAMQSSGAAGPSLAPARLAIDGHSFADYEDGSTGGPPQGRRRSSRGIGGWLQLLTGGKISCLLSRDFGVNGQTSAQIAARVAATVSGSVDCGGFLVPGSLQINDRGSANLTLQQSIDATITYFDALVATNKPVFYSLTTPRDATLMTNSDANGVAQTTNFLNFLEWERTGLPARYGSKITTSDVFDQFVDPARSPRVSPIGGVTGGGRNPTTDGTHPSPSAAFTMANDLAPKVLAQTPASLLVDPITALLTGRTNLVANPALANTGTPGTTSGGGSVTGTVPTGDVVVSNSGHAATITIDKVTPTGTWLEISDTYTGSGGADSPEFRIAIGAIADGDIIQFAVEVEMDVPSGALIELMAGVRIGTSGTTYIAAEEYRTSSLDFMPLTAYSGILICEPVTISGLGASTPSFIVRIASGAAVSAGTFRIKKNRVALVKL